MTLRRCLVAIAACGAAVGIACDSGTDVEFTLDDVSDPDTNTVVVVLSRAVQTGRFTLAAGVEHVYAVRTDRVPHTLLGELVVGADTSRVAFVVSALWEAGPVLTDGVGNLFFWTDLEGRRHDPVYACVLDVVEPYVLGRPSLQRVQTACRTQVGAEEVLTIYAKGARFLGVGGSAAPR